MDDGIKQRVIIQFLVSQQVTAIVIYKQLKAFFGDSTLSENSVGRWVREI